MLTFVKNKFNQVSLVACKEFKKDEIVFEFDLDMCEVFTDPDLRTIELAPHLHVDHPWGRYTNHNCEPTCYVDKINRVMRAARPIKVGEEINFDYTMNETNISTSFQCQCGSYSCKGLIGSKNSKPTHLGASSANTKG